MFCVCRKFYSNTTTVVELTGRRANQLGNISSSMTKKNKSMGGVIKLT